MRLLQPMEKSRESNTDDSEGDAKVDTYQQNR